jgi:hypothetical protein
MRDAHANHCCERVNDCDSDERGEQRRRRDDSKIISEVARLIDAISAKMHRDVT